jgi:putative ABC transport system permease protein
MEILRQDIRYAFRRLLKSPGFTIIAVMTLALGIGANSAIFSVINGVLLRPLPYPEPERLVGLFHLFEGDRDTMSGPNFFDVKTLSQTLSDAAAVSRSRLILTGRGEPVRLDGAEVSGSLFSVLGVQALLGRTLRPGDNQPGANRAVVVLGYGLWQQRFGSDPNMIGRKITLDGVATEVVGVMPEGFAYPAGRVLWTPLEYNENFISKQRSAWYLTAIGRMKPGVSLDQVSSEVTLIGKQVAAKYPDSNEGLDFAAAPLLEAMVGDVRKAMLILLGAVGLVLLIACVNVANLLLARAAARESEMAFRTALGAGRGRLVRQLLTESVLLSLCGAGLGLLLAVWGVDMLIGLQPQGVPRLDNVRIDATVAAFTLVLASGTGVLFGLVPALQITRGSIAGGLKEAGRSALTSRSGSRVRSALVVSEIALAVMLLAGAGLLIRSFTRLASVDPGFRVEPALTFELTLPDARYEKEPQQVAYFDQLMPKLRGIPGVQSAAAVVSLPLSGSSIVLNFEIAGRPPLPPSQQPAMQVRVATPDYFQTVGIPLKRGRAFTGQDREGTPPVVLITESAAKQYFPNEEPLGKRITLGWGRGPGTPRAGGEVVGIIGDVKDAGLHEADPPQIYLPYRQWPLPSMAVVLRTSVRPERVADAARRAVYSVDANIPVGNVRTLQQVVERSISQPRFYMTLLTIFASLALVLAAIGTFGVLSYAVAQRSREIGIRMALGAQERTVIGLIVRHAMILAAGGVTLGVTAAWFLSKLLATFLFATDPRDLTTFAAVSLTLGLVALIASYLPARRATRIDPVVALRTE